MSLDVCPVSTMLPLGPDKAYQALDFCLGNEKHGCHALPLTPEGMFWSGLDHDHWCGL